MTKRKALPKSKPLLALQKSVMHQITVNTEYFHLPLSHIILASEVLMGDLFGNY